LTEIGTTEQAARDREVIRARRDDSALSMLIRTRARIIKDEPPPDLQRAQDATRDARTRSAWAAWHRDQAQRHRATLTDLILHHEREAERLLE